MLKHSGSATRLGADSPDERGGWERALRERGRAKERKKDKVTYQNLPSDHDLS